MIIKYGIDFGTTNSSIAVRYMDESENEFTELIDLKAIYPKETIPTIFCISEDGDIVAGSAAYQQLSILKHANKKARIIKRIKMDLENNPSHFSYKIGNKVVSGVDLISSMLRLLRQKAEKELEDLSPDGVVMGVPVKYGDTQKKILIEALFKAGFYSSITEANRKTEFVSEPVAVAVHYGLTNTDDKTVMVFDFGGGTLDVAVVNLKEQLGDDYLHPHEVKGKDRLTLGGEDLTKKFFKRTFCGKEGYGTRAICEAFHFDKNLTADQLWEKLEQHNIGPEFIDAIDQCKYELSTAKRTTFTFVGDAGIRFDRQLTIHRDSFEDAISDELDKINELIDSVLEQAEIDDVFEIDYVIIAGGSSLIPCIQELLISKFGRKKVVTDPGRILKRFDTEKEVLTSIVRGLAAVGFKKNDSRRFDDVIDCDYGVWVDARNTFDPILHQGTPVKEASKFDKVFQEGAYEEYITQHSTQKTVTMQIFQSNAANAKTPYSKLGTVFIEDAGGKEYKVFMHIDPDKGMLLVDIYDTKKKRWIPISQDEKEFSIKIKN